MSKLSDHHSHFPTPFTTAKKKKKTEEGKKSLTCRPAHKYEMKYQA